MRRLPPATALAAAAALVLSAATAPATAVSDRATAPEASPGTYTNAVSDGTVEGFPDPSMIRGLDGAWYAYSTSNTPFVSQGDREARLLPIIRSTDMVTWEYVDSVFDLQDPPSWWPGGATRAWAPDIRRVDGRYHLTYSLSSGGVGLATSDSPAGPWEDRGRLVPNGGSGCPTFDIDQAMFTDADGTHYLYWGSYDTICVSAMTDDATALTGEVTTVGYGRRAEAPYVVHRGDYYYLFFSDAGCCDGPFSGYTVKVGRSEDPRGPFLTEDGQPLTDDASKGGIVLTANGNRWIGPGHNAVQTDLAGQDWIVYHAVPEDDPAFPPGPGARWKRPMLMDRLDWVDGWPVARAGAGPSQEPESAPITRPVAGSTFNGPPGRWSATGDGDAVWQVVQEPEALGVLEQSAAPQEPARYLTRRVALDDVRLEAGVRMTGEGTGGAVGVVLDQAPRRTVTAWVDRGAGELAVAVEVDGETTRTTAPLPASFDHGTWHDLAVELRGDRLEAEVSADRLGGPLATVSATLPGDRGGVRPGRVGVASVGAPAQADNVSAAPLHEQVAERVPEPTAGAALAASSDEFDVDGRPGGDDGWTWVRGDAADAVVQDGALRWTTQARGLQTSNNSASVLLRDAPDGDFLVETEMAFDGDRPFQQAGLVLYQGDDRYLKLVHSVLPLARRGGQLTHQSEFLKESPWPEDDPDGVFAGPMFGGPPAGTTWLRLAHHLDAERDVHVARMATSTDGQTWTWGGAWTLPVGDPLRIGLVAMGGSGATARFEHVRTTELER